MSPKPPGHEPEKKVSSQSLVAFMKQKTRASCPICQLPPEIQAQLGASATKRGFTRDDQLEWLRVAVGVSHVTSEMLSVHLNGKHDRPEEPNVAQPQG